MTYYFDQSGWLSTTPLEGRSTTVAPPSTSLPDGHAWNFVGVAGREWVALPLVQLAVGQPAPPPQDERLWWLDVGPFIDRLGMDGAAVGASNHEACKGVMALLTGRKYIDLKDPRISAMLDILIAAQQPAASMFFPGSGPMTTAKKAAILNTPATDKERHVKGLI